LWDESYSIGANSLNNEYREVNEANVQYVGVVLDPKTEGFLPLYAHSQKRGYDGQTQTPDSARLLLVEVLYEGEILKNQDFRK
jgi:hypothetical protein